MLEAPEGAEGCTEGSVGRFKAVVRAMSFSACSADVGLRLALANCSTDGLCFLETENKLLHTRCCLQHWSEWSDSFPWKNGQKSKSGMTGASSTPVTGAWGLSLGGQTSFVDDVSQTITVDQITFSVVRTHQGSQQTIHSGHDSNIRFSLVLVYLIMV